MARAGPVRVSVRFRVNRHWLLVTRTVKVPAATEVTVPLRPTGRQLRSLRRALASEGSLSGLVQLGAGDMVIGPGQRVRRQVIGTPRTTSTQSTGRPHASR